jgi:hypothetical protein
LRRNYLQEHAIEGNIERRIEMTGRRVVRRKQLLYDIKGKEKIPEIEKGCTSLPCVENSLWKRLWTSPKTDYRMNEKIYVFATTHKLKRFRLLWEMSFSLLSVFFNVTAFVIHTSAAMFKD